MDLNGGTVKPRTGFSFWKSHHSAMISWKWEQFQHKENTKNLEYNRKVDRINPIKYGLSLTGATSDGQSISFARKLLFWKAKTTKASPTYNGIRRPGLETVSESWYRTSLVFEVFTPKRGKEWPFFEQRISFQAIQFN